MVQEYFLADSLGEGTYGSVRLCYDEDGSEWVSGPKGCKT